jgi:Na+/proline symporter
MARMPAFFATSWLFLGAAEDVWDVGLEELWEALGASDCFCALGAGA